jgi:hypothetical protein
MGTRCSFREPRFLVFLFAGIDEQQHADTCVGTVNRAESERMGRVKAWQETWHSQLWSVTNQSDSQLWLRQVPNFDKRKRRRERCERLKSLQYYEESSFPSEITPWDTETFTRNTFPSKNKPLKACANFTRQFFLQKRDKRKNIYIFFSCEKGLGGGGLLSANTHEFCGVF